MERKTNKCMLDKMGYVCMLIKSMSERNRMFFGHIVPNKNMEQVCYRGRWKASGEGADLQRPGSRI